LRTEGLRHGHEFPSPNIPTGVEIIPELIETGVEELVHFQRVHVHMAKRGIRLAKEMSEDPYIKALLAHCRTDPLNRFLDRLLLASIIECRGAERFRLLWAALEHDAELRSSTTSSGSRRPSMATFSSKWP